MNQETLQFLNNTIAFGMSGFVLAVLLMLRNEFVFHVRRTLIGRGSSARLSYNKLPSHTEMVWDLRYWTLWTPEQWRVWMKRQ